MSFDVAPDERPASEAEKARLNETFAALAASMAKAYVTDAYRNVAGAGIQLHGGIGFTWEHDLHLYFKRAKSSEFTFGDATYHRERVAQLINL